MKLNDIKENIGLFNRDGSQKLEYLSNSIDFLKNNNLPNSKNELWKYTSLSTIKDIDFVQYNDEKIIEWSINDLYKIKDIPQNTSIIPIINGRLKSNLINIDKRFSIFENDIQELNQYAKNYHPNQSVEADNFYHLNTVLAQKEINLKIQKNTDTIQLLFLFISQSDDNAIISPRIRIELEENTNVKIAYKFINFSKSEIFSNLFSEIILNQNALLDFYILENELYNFQSINNINIIQKRDSKFSSNTFTYNSKFIRNFLRIYLAEENAEAQLNGLFMGFNNNTIDNHIFIEHLQPNCFSNQLYKGILNDNSTGIFNGSILVHPHAQKTNAFQVNRNLLTSESAKIYTKPELEIYADDVKCSHGEATGLIDEEMLFYMQSRGISEENAKHLLLEAFAMDVLNKFGWEEIRNSLISNISKENDYLDKI
ncbi:MAG TPA: Fe-S cluster assembly protein SufD [Candidatus Kapabacteria bacterium]|nr:Fe-S cluster assembly protein SufD [Candidatus Kapabacteria bacterium]